MVRMRVYQICYGRAIFPNDAFTTVDVSGMEKGMQARKLNREYSDETKLLIDWVEHGVMDALTNKYLETLSFIVTAEDPRQLRETDALEALEQYVINTNASLATTITGVMCIFVFVQV